MVIPIGQGRFRVYFIYRYGTQAPLSGQKGEAAFVAGCGSAGGSSEWFEGAELIGPLATFNGADRWVDDRYREEVVLIGDAAACSDPSAGAGLSLTLRDVRVLCECLTATEDWVSAARSYARQHDTYYARLHRLHDWSRELIFHTGLEAEAKRAVALPKLAADPTRRPDVLGLGPDAPCDEAARQRFFGLD